jgi:hypothetical protein
MSAGNRDAEFATVMALVQVVDALEMAVKALVKARPPEDPGEAVEWVKEVASIEPQVEAAMKTVRAGLESM